MDNVPEGQVALILRDMVTGDELAAYTTAVIPRRNEFVRHGGKVRVVYDVEHEFIKAGDRFIHGVTVRLMAPL